MKINYIKLWIMLVEKEMTKQELSWSHYRVLMQIDDVKRRNFYLTECTGGNWSVRQTVMVGEEAHKITRQEADKIHRYLIRNDYVDYDDNITDEYRIAADSGRLAVLPAELSALSVGIHTLVQGIFDDSIPSKMIDNGNKPKVQENPLNDNFYKQEFKELWSYINHIYAYTVDFDSSELIQKAIAAINARLIVTKLQYTLTTGAQRTDMNPYLLERSEHSMLQKHGLAHSNTLRSVKSHMILSEKYQRERF